MWKWKFKLFFSLRPGSGRKGLSSRGVFRTLSKIYDNTLYKITRQKVLSFDKVLNKPLRFANNRSSLPDVFCKKGVLKISQNSLENNLHQSLILNKVAGYRLQLYKKETLPQVFSCEFSAIFKNTYFTEHLRWLFLKKT